MNEINQPAGIGISHWAVEEPKASHQVDESLSEEITTRLRVLDFVDANKGKSRLKPSKATLKFI